MTTTKTTPSEPTGTKLTDFFCEGAFVPVGHCASKGLVQCDFCSWTVEEEKANKEKT